MTDLLRVGATVATPLGLIGFVVAVLALLYQRQLRHQEEQLKALPPEQRAQSVDRFLSRYGLDAGNLTREQKFQLLQQELEKRFRTVQFGMVASAVTFVACVFFGVGAYVVVNQTPGAWGALLAALLMITATGVGLYALNRWAPGKPAAAAVDSFAELRSDLEEANRIVQTLDSTFIDLARGYADRGTLLDPQQRHALIADTDTYLYDRVLLPRLVIIKGSMESKAADASTGRKVKELPGLLQELAGRIGEY
jgi:hypothetical protein